MIWKNASIFLKLIKPTNFIEYSYNIKLKIIQDDSLIYTKIYFKYICSNKEDLIERIRYFCNKDP